MRICEFAALDAHLIGIYADYKLHVAERLLVQNDGPMLEAAQRRDDLFAQPCQGPPESGPACAAL